MWQAIQGFKRDECSRTREMLSGYLDRSLAPEELARVEDHLRDCRGCRQDLGSMRATVALLRGLPQVVPSRSFTVAPVAPLPGRAALQALRFAAVGAVLLLMVTFAADWMDLFQKNPLSKEQLGSTSNFAPAKSSDDGNSYWVVSGVKNTIDAEPETPVELVMPDGTDNVVRAVNCLAAANRGVLYGSVAYQADNVERLVLVGEAEGSAGAEDMKTYVVVTASAAEPSPFAPNGEPAGMSAFDAIVEGQTKDCLNILSSDNAELYSFDLESAQREVIAAGEDDWLRPLEYGLIGLVAVLGGSAAALWLRQRRARKAEAG